MGRGWGEDGERMGRGWGEDGEERDEAARRIPPRCCDLGPTSGVSRIAQRDCNAAQGDDEDEDGERFKGDPLRLGKKNQAAWRPDRNGLFVFRRRRSKREPALPIRDIAPAPIPGVYRPRPWPPLNPRPAPRGQNAAPDPIGRTSEGGLPQPCGGRSSTPTPTRL